MMFSADKTSVILKKDALNPNTPYHTTLLLTNKEGGNQVTGKTVYFTTSAVPKDGTVTVTPTTDGTMFDTVFEVALRKW